MVLIKGIADNRVCHCPPFGYGGRGVYTALTASVPELLRHGCQSQNNYYDGRFSAVSILPAPVRFISADVVMHGHETVSRVR